MDRIETFYINGMFTDPAAFLSNLYAIEKFLSQHLSDAGFNTTPHGSHNRSEFALFQALEVARQKLEDEASTGATAILEFINGDPQYLRTEEGIAAVQEYLDDINTVYSVTLTERDTENAIEGLTQLLDTCSRVVMLTHSQGNFYGNAIFNEIYATYTFPNGYSIAQYPMLATMQIASPANVPGGAASGAWPEIVGHLTNDNDLVMAMVRGTLGSVRANYESPENPNDWTGHGLEASYLMPEGQALEIKHQMQSIASNLWPYPLNPQTTASSSALSGFGYSAINQILDIEFGNGGIYRYSNVPASIYEDLLNATSQGSFFNTYVRDAFIYERLE